MAWIAAGASILTSLGAGGAAKKKSKEDFKNQQVLNEQEGGISRKNSQFNMELEYYYKQLDKQNKMRGLDEFRKFSTVKNYKPGYVNTTPAAAMPAMPQATAGAYAVAPAAAAAPASSGGSDSWHGLGGIAGVLLGH